MKRIKRLSTICVLFCLTAFGHPLVAEANSATCNAYAVAYQACVADSGCSAATLLATIDILVDEGCIEL